MRGEHVPRASTNGAMGGSSPHAWGTLPLKAVLSHRGRFIPTCVGNTPNVCPNPAAIPVHPHMRGEHGVTNRERVSKIGSSPHAWGTQNRER